jgi:ribosomal protein S18 acetylase RimI-like enzyme
MSPVHPLDRPAWGALITRQSSQAIGDGLARRFDPAFGPFAATADDSPESLAALTELIAASGSVVLMQAEEWPTPPGARVAFRASAWQMIADPMEPTGDEPELIRLGDADAPEMLALAQLTKPGPFSDRTHELGEFFGVRRSGRLAAMAGERMQPPGFVEISGVCTHPDYRGQGFGAALTRQMTRRIQARGETAFLHVMADNASALALYATLGFVRRREMSVTALVMAV